jgi:hypothetical protein
MKRILIALIGLALIAPAFAADEAVSDATVESTVITRVSPGGFSAEIVGTPVARVDGVAQASVTSILVTKWQNVRTLKDGVQVGPVKRESLGTRDCTAFFRARVNPDTGLPLALVIADTKALWLAIGWNNSGPAGE